MKVLPWESPRNNQELLCRSLLDFHYHTGVTICVGQVEILSDDDDDDDDDDLLPVNSDDRYRPQALEKMISLIAVLVEKSRGDDKQLHLSQKDMMAIIGGKVWENIIDYDKLLILRSVCTVGWHR